MLSPHSLHSMHPVRCHNVPNNSNHHSLSLQNCYSLHYLHFVHLYNVSYMLLFIFHNTNTIHNSTLNHKTKKTTQAAILGISTLRISCTAKTKSPFSHTATLFLFNCSHIAIGHINNTAAVQHKKQFHTSWYYLQDDITVTGRRFILLSQVTSRIPNLST